MRLHGGHIVDYFLTFCISGIQFFYNNQGLFGSRYYKSADVLSGAGASTISLSSQRTL